MRRISDGPTYLFVDFSNFAIRSGAASLSPYGLVRRALLRTRDVVRLTHATHVAFALDPVLVSPRYAGTLDKARSSVAGRLLGELGYPTYAAGGWSADDILVSLAAQAEAAGYHAIVTSGDHGLRRALGERTDVLEVKSRPGGVRLVWRTAQALQASGISVADHLALGTRQVSDRSQPAIVDGRTAKRLLVEFGSIDALYANIAAVEPDGLRARLLEMEPVARARAAHVAARAISPVCFDPSLGRLGAGTIALVEPSLAGLDRLTIGTSV